MIVWTKQEWLKELDKFSSMVKESKKYERVSYPVWCSLTKIPDGHNIKMVLNPSFDYVITITDEIIEREINLDQEAPSFIRFLKDKYSTLTAILMLNSRAVPIKELLNVAALHENSGMTNCATVASNSTKATSNIVLNGYDYIGTDNYASTGTTITDWSVLDYADIKIDGEPITASKLNGTIAIDNSGLNITIQEAVKEAFNQVFKEEKENKDMNFFKNFEFGPVKSDSVRLSPYGLAVQNMDKTWVTYDGNQEAIIDVDVFNFEGKNLIYKIPAAPQSIREGDMIIHQGKAMYVLHDVEEDATSIVVIDPRAGESKEILPTRSPFGFNFVTKLISLLDMTGIDANPDNPFGNMWMLALMGDKDCDMGSAMMAMMMCNNGSMDMSNPMMMFALMNNSEDKSSMMLPMLMMMNQQNK